MAENKHDITDDLMINSRGSVPNRIEQRSEVKDTRLEALEAELLGKLDGLDLGYNDKFALPDDIPEGWAYGWKRHESFGMEDKSNIVDLAANGWQYVPSSRHPEMMPSGHKGNIERGGMVLMEIPKRVNDRLIEIRERNAATVVAEKEVQIGNTFSANKDKARPITKTVGPVIVD